MPKITISIEDTLTGEGCIVLVTPDTFVDDFVKKVASGKAPTVAEDVAARTIMFMHKSNESHQIATPPTTCDRCGLLYSEPSSLCMNAHAKEREEAPHGSLEHLAR